MATDPNAVEQAVSRTLRDNLEKIQRTADEVHEAVNDMVSACASSRASNALPPMVRAQTTAASLSATLEVLSRLVTSALLAAMRSPYEADVSRVPAISTAPDATFEPPLPAPPSAFEHPLPVPPAPPVVAFEPPAPVPHSSAPPAATFEQPLAAPSHPIEEVSWVAPTPVVPVPPVPTPPVVESALPPEPAPVVMDAHTQGEAPAHTAIPEVPEVSAAVETHEPAESIPPVEPVNWEQAVPASEYELAPELEAGPPAEEHPEFAAHEAVEEAERAAPIEQVAEVEQREAAPVFNLDLLPPEEQELHRRAFRVAKVSMQDIRMLRPEDVRIGRENRDLCFRLRDDIEKAHKEYDRRFQSIQSHPVDYFYDWMVEILGGGDPQALGEYPYPSPVLRR